MRRGNRLALAVVPRLAAALIRGLHITLRIRHIGRAPLDDLERAGVRYIHAFWHGRLLLMPYSYRGRRITILRQDTEARAIGQSQKNRRPRRGYADESDESKGQKRCCGHDHPSWRQITDIPAG